MSVVLAKTNCFKMNVTFSFQCNNIHSLICVKLAKATLILKQREYIIESFSDIFDQNTGKFIFLIEIGFKRHFFLFENSVSDPRTD